jgi:GNAT superfamily N-acetyltransferase
MTDPTLAALRVAVRPAQPADSRGIAAVESAAWRDAYAGLIPAAALDTYLGLRRPDAWRAMVSANGREVVFVAHDADGVIGFASCGPVRDRLCRRAGFTGELYTLYVHPAWQGAGVGRRLFEEVRDCLIAAGRRDLLAWMLKGGPAAPFYRRLHGRRLWERPGSLCGARLTEVAFCWRNLE